MQSRQLFIREHTASTAMGTMLRQPAGLCGHRSLACVLQAQRPAASAAEKPKKGAYTTQQSCSVMQSSFELAIYIIELIPHLLQTAKRPHCPGLQCSQRHTAGHKTLAGRLS